MGAVGNRRGSDEDPVRPFIRESCEDYLEAILVIRAERGFCRNVDVAEFLGVTKPSVTKALANLTCEGLVSVVGYDVRLTSEGRRLAEETFAKHRFFEGMLLDAGVDAEVACRMEHCISGDSFRRLADCLGSRRDGSRDE